MSRHLSVFLVAALSVACSEQQKAKPATNSDPSDSSASLPQEWIPTPWVTAKSREAGNAGGEGTQWPQALEVAPTRPDDLYLGTDVGGIYRSRDGGKNWQPANIGLNPRGATDFAIDPNNPDRVLLVGCNSVVQPDHGVWLSEDRGETWSSGSKLAYKGYRDFRDQLAFDRTTYDAEAKLTRVVYWSTPKQDSGKSHFQKSADGGRTWKKVETELPLGNALVRTHPTKGWLYVANDSGLFRSKDGAATFEKLLGTPVGGIDISPDKDVLYLVSEDTLRISNDGGYHFTSVVPEAFPKRKGKSNSAALKVSPANSKHLLIDRDMGDWNWTRFVSLDGGETWKKSSYDTPKWETFIPGNNRQAAFVWHPQDPTVAWTFGGDFVVRSGDSGLTWKWSNSGYTGVMVGSSFSFNAQYPDLLYVPSQDYDGAVTADGGHTWDYVNLSGEGWGGFNYGGYAFSQDVIAVGNRLGWGGPVTLHITRDGGKTREKTSIKLGGLPVGFGHPKDPKIAFLYDHRTNDGGVTWEKMADCSGVLAADPNTGEMFGASNNRIVSSINDGITWTKRADVPGANSLRDMALDYLTNSLYVVCNNEKFWKVDPGTGEVKEITSTLPPDQHGNRAAQSVAVDPTDPQIVYLGKAGNLYAKDTSVLRSLDSGKTWKSLTRNLRGSVTQSGPDGGREANWLRVHPVSRQLYVGTNCFGFWRYPPPQSGAE